MTEAAYAGLPIVATDVGGARELVAEGPGRLVKPPFESIGDLNFRTIGRLVHGQDPPFITTPGRIHEGCHQLAPSGRPVG